MASDNRATLTFPRIAVWRPAVAFGLTAEAKVLATILGFTILRFCASAITGLGVDEAYSLSISRELHLSYFDHPPLHQWIAHFSEAVFGPGPLVRTPFIAMFAASSWVLFRLTRRLFNAEAGVWAVLALNLAGFFSVAAGEWILPDGPLLLGLLLCALVLARIFFPQAGEGEARTTHWLQLGLWLGLAALAKYHAALFALGVAGFLLATPRGRATLRTPGPYLAAAVTLAVLTPVVIWNAEHHWASFAFQAGRGGGERIKLQKVVQAVLGGVALLLPWVAVPLIWAAVSAARRRWSDLRTQFCLALALPPIVLFTLLPIMGGSGLPHWSMPGWLFLFPLLGDALARRANTAGRWTAGPRVWATASFVALACIWAAAATDAHLAWLPRAFPDAIKKDPTLEQMSWGQIKPALDSRGLLDESGTYVVALKWMEAGKIEQALGHNHPMRLLADEAHQYAFNEAAPIPVGGDVVILASQNTAEGELQKLAPYFRSVTREPSIFIGRGRPELEIVVYKGHDLLRPYAYAPIPW